MSMTTRKTAQITAPVDLTERLVAGDAFRIRPIRKPRVTKRDWRTNDGEAHPVTVRRVYVAWHEVALTDECEFGCKVYERTIGTKTERKTMHNSAYGCTPNARLFAADKAWKDALAALDEAFEAAIEADAECEMTSGAEHEAAVVASHEAHKAVEAAKAAEQRAYDAVEALA